MVKNLPANTGDAGDRSLIPGTGRSPGGRHGNALQYSCMENPMSRRAWWGYKPWGCKRIGCNRVTELEHESESENEVTQSCQTLCDPMDYSLPGSSVHEIFQARVLE